LKSSYKTTSEYGISPAGKRIQISVEKNYLAESHYKEEIIVRVTEEKDNSILINHSIFRSSDNTELCRIKIGCKESNFKVN